MCSFTFLYCFGFVVTCSQWKIDYLYYITSIYLFNKRVSKREIQTNLVRYIGLRKNLNIFLVRNVCQYILFQNHRTVHVTASFNQPIDHRTFLDQMPKTKMSCLFCKPICLFYPGCINCSDLNRDNRTTKT